MVRPELFDSFEALDRQPAQQPIQIYQDNYDIFEPMPMISHAQMPSMLAVPNMPTMPNMSALPTVPTLPTTTNMAAGKPSSSRRPLQSTDGNVILNPPSLPSNGKQTSPHKGNMSLGGKELGHGITKLNKGPTMRPASSGRAAPTDNLLKKKQPPMSKLKNTAQRAGADGCNKENVQPWTAHSFNVAQESYYTKASGKRGLLEPAAIKELRPGKKPRTTEALPQHDIFPAVEDDGTKPCYSYAQLIAMAIVRSPQHRLTLASIYKWISEHYSFYKPNDAGWQNSIRHNLSLNKHFIKMERPKDDPGKGSYWSIEPGAEQIYLKDKMVRKPATGAENVPVMSTRLEPSPLFQVLPSPLMPQQHQQHNTQQLQPPMQPVMTPETMVPQDMGPPPTCQPSLPALPASSQMPPPMHHTDLSSDATIAAPEVNADDFAERDDEVDALHGLDHYTGLQSSPPIARHINFQHMAGTPSPLQHYAGSSVAKPRSHKRKRASMDDSGYISSLESSAVRPNLYGNHHTMCTRAEDEIARLRGSSYDSPTKNRCLGLPNSASSPSRRNNERGQMLPPVTPATKLKAPPRPPPSVSPATNLSFHRQHVQSMLDSPFRRANAVCEKNKEAFDSDRDFCSQMWSTLHDGSFVADLGPIEDEQDVGFGLDIYQDQDQSYMFMSMPSPAAFHNGSPIKRPAKRPRIDRSFSTSVLDDFTQAALNNVHTPAHTPSLTMDTPGQLYDGLPSSPSKAPFVASPIKGALMQHENQENVPPPAWNMGYDYQIPSEVVEDDSLVSIDIMAGFQKIGAANPAPTPRSTNKPFLGRSISMNF